MRDLQVLWGVAWRAYLAHGLCLPAWITGPLPPLQVGSWGAEKVEEWETCLANGAWQARQACQEWEACLVGRCGRRVGVPMGLCETHSYRHTHLAQASGCAYGSADAGSMRACMSMHASNLVGEGVVWKRP